MKKFTLIELIIVVVVIGIIASIVTLNISNTRKDAHVVAIKANVVSMQQGTDYLLFKEEKLPNLTEMAIGTPSNIDYDLLDPKYIHSQPDLENAYYWIDYNGEIWGSTVDAPNYMEFDENVVASNFSLPMTSDISRTFIWKESEDAVEYILYTLAEGKKNALKEVGRTSNTHYLIDDISLSEKDIFVASIDENGLETPPVNSNYAGFGNVKPVAIIESNVPNNKKVSTLETLTFTASGNVPAVNKEWIFNGQKINDITTVKQVLGENEIMLRIEDSNGVKSDWTKLVFTAENLPPVVSLNLKNGDVINAKVAASFEKKFTDPEGEGVPTQEEFTVNGSLVTFEELNTTFPVGNYAITYRAKDSEGNWSNKYTFNLTIENKPPVVTLTVKSPVVKDINETTAVTFTETFVDPEGTSRIAVKEYLVNGKVKTSINGYYNSGNHTIRYRVQDTDGLWSQWVEVKFYSNRISGSDFYWYYHLGGTTYGEKSATVNMPRRGELGNVSTLTLKKRTGSAKVTITVGGYGVGNEVPHTPSFESGKTQNYRLGTLKKTISTSGGFSIGYSYTDSFIHITKIEVDKTGITYIE